MQNAIRRLALCFFFVLGTLVSAERAIAPVTQQKIDEFMHLRMTLSVLDDRDKAVARIREFEKDTVPLLRAAQGEQDALILENLIVSEVFNYYFDNPPISRDEFRKMLADQKAKDDAYFDAHKGETFSEWFWATSGDVYSCWTTFSIKDILLYGTTIKKYYLSAYEVNPQCSLALMALGQWYFQAPGVGGGSNKKARAYFEQARASSRNSAETYFADIFFSQFLFEQKEFAAAKTLLDEADSLNPNSAYIALIRAQNENGVSLYQYNRKRSRYEK